jgi:2'-5' RNA ligase
MKMYFVAIVLPEELNKEVRVFKDRMLAKWGCKVGLKSPAHITLIPPFWMDETLQTELLRDLDVLCSSLHPFPITTNNFAAFKPRTIFIQPVLHEGLKKLKRATDSFCKAHKQYGAKADNRPFHPHITIATRDLHKQAFAEAWLYFEQQKFEVVFDAKGLSVLRHNTQAWDVIHTSPFGG